jgi:TM2 domain-containing membrane protein YozV
MFCSKCGKEVNDEAIICTNCGCAISNAGKSKIAAGLLGIFLGTLGIHNFYLGKTNKAVTQLVLGIVGILTSWLIIGVFIMFGVGIWGFIEGIQCLMGTYKDAQGKDLID